MWHCTTRAAWTLCFLLLYPLYLLSGRSPKRVVYQSWSAIAALERCHNEKPDNERIIWEPELPTPTRQPQFISQAPLFGHGTYSSSLQSWASFSCVHSIKPSHKTKRFAIWRASHAWSCRTVPLISSSFCHAFLNFYPPFSTTAHFFSSWFVCSADMPETLSCHQCDGLMVSALVSGSSGLGSSSDWGHCVVFLDKRDTLFSQCLSLPRCIYEYQWTSWRQPCLFRLLLWGPLE